MVRKTIHRTFTSTKILYATVSLVDGETKTSEVEELIVDGNIKADRALHILRDRGFEDAVVLKVEQFDEKYKIAVKDFKQYGELMEE